MTEEQLEKDILFQIDMQLYDEFNDKFCEINEHLGDVYTYKDLQDLENAEKEKERTLLRKAIQKQDTEINKLKQENNTLKEQVQMFIPRRRVRRVYKMLGKILRTDIDPILLEKELKSKERRGEYE